jgi:hypothetical protein
MVRINVPRQNIDAIKGVLLVGRGKVRCDLEVDAGDYVFVQQIEVEGGWVRTGCVRTLSLYCL